MRQVKKDSTNVSVEIYIVDSTDGTPETGVVWNTSGIDLNYRRDGAVVTSITEATLAALTTAHTDGGFLHVANGRYRLDVPDAAFATGVSQVTIGGTVTGMVVLPVTIQLVAFDPDDAVRLGVTALPNAAADAAGGLAISDAGGLDLDTKLGYLTAAVAVASVCTETRLAELDAGNLPLTTDNILTDTGTTLEAHLTDIKGTSFIKDTHSLIDIATDTAEIGAAGAGLTAINLPNQTMDITGNLSGSVGSVTGAVGSVTGAVGSVTGHTAQTGDTYAIANGAAGFVAIDTVVDAIKVITDALGATAAANLALSAGQIITGTVSNAVLTPTTTAFAADDITEATADHYNGRIVIFTSGALAGQATDITDYSLVSSEGNFTVTAMTEAPANNDTFIIV